MDANTYGFIWKQITEQKLDAGSKASLLLLLYKLAKRMLLQHHFSDTYLLHEHRIEDKGLGTLMRY